MAEKYTRKQFQAQYPDDSACLQAILQRRYGKADACPKCGVVGKLTRIEERRGFAYKEAAIPTPAPGRSSSIRLRRLPTGSMRCTS